MRTTTHGMTRYIAPFLDGGEVQWRTKKSGQITRNTFVKASPEGIIVHQGKLFSLEEAILMRDALDDAIQFMKDIHSSGVSPLYATGAFRE